ncbi:sensor histidine kinase [Clostridium sp. WILCCON 0269]|uniref:histidine kinase n=1 Tax=Candidatus Clostridium eludens TaxID=3381663 RepID=A0ABW8SPX7_9CLOT
MNKLIYIKNSVLKIIYFSCIFIVINLILFSSGPIDASFYDIAYMDFLIIAISLFFMFIDYRRWKYNYKEIYKSVTSGEKINLSASEENDAFEVWLIKEVLKMKDKERNKKVQEVRDNLDEINDYITKWIHEVKIPLSVCELILDKMDETDISEELRLEMDRIKFLINQVLYISRASSFSEDFQVSEIDIAKIIKAVVKKNASFFIAKKINLNLEDIDFNVITDGKWISYIIDQIINNSCKYMHEGGQIDIWGEENEKRAALHIRDNGIGIEEKDIRRIFDKGFTGENGRQFGKSTGMGLYLSKKIIDKLNHQLKVKSQVGSGTESIICFYKLSDYFNVT